VRHGADLEDLDRLVDALQPIVAVAADLHRRVETGAVERPPRRRSEQRLPPRAMAITLAASGFARPSTSTGFAPSATSSADACLSTTAPTCSPARAARPSSAIAKVIVQGMARGVGNGVEQQEETVGAVDLAAMVATQQVARPAIVLGPQGARALVAETLRRQGAVDGIGEQQRDDLAHRSPAGGPFWRF
jgi:hypothetical protein